MADILLTHGYFLAEDEKERQIMKPYPPLGLLYLSAFLKHVAGFASRCSTAPSRNPRTLVRALRGRPRRRRRHLHQSHDAAIGARDRARGETAPLDRVLGGPESANYIEEYLGAGADVIVIGEGELTLDASCCRRCRAAERTGCRACTASHSATRPAPCVRTADAAARARLDSLPFPDREAIDHRSLSRRVEDSSRREQHQSDHRPRLPVPVQLVLTRRVRAIRTAGAARRTWPTRCSGSSIVTIPTRSGTPTTCSPSATPGLRRYTAELERRGIHRPFETITRADRLQNEGAAALLRELGCYRIWIGSESGSQRILDAMQRGVTSSRCSAPAKLAHAHGIEVGMFLMWGYDGEELEDIAATVEHVKQSNPDIFFTTVSYPIKGTGYFDKVRDRVRLADRVGGSVRSRLRRRGPARQGLLQARRSWLRNEVEAFRLATRDPDRAAELLATARRARDSLRRWERPT